MRIADIESGQEAERQPIVEETDSNQIFSVVFAQQDVEIFRISTENIVGRDEEKYDLQILMSEGMIPIGVNPLLYHSGDVCPPCIWFVYFQRLIFFGDLTIIKLGIEM